jgi:DNA polymerase III epsilon subunit-like protein
MIVLDVETTGLDPRVHGIVSIGAVDFLNASNTFYQECRIWDGCHITDEALAINGYSREQITDSSKKSDKEIVEEFFAWLDKTEAHTIAGQNPFYDAEMVQHVCLRNSMNFPLAKRIVDLHSTVFIHMHQRNLEIPVKNKHSNINSDFIMTYVGIPTEPKPHIALNGAIWEAEAFSRLMHEKSLFPQFAGYPIPWLSK